MQPDHAVIVPPGGGVRYGNVEFLGLSEHTPRLNVSVITMAPGRGGPRRVAQVRPAARGRCADIQTSSIVKASSPTSRNSV